MTAVKHGLEQNELPGKDQSSLPAPRARLEQVGSCSIGPRSKEVWRKGWLACCLWSTGAPCWPQAHITRSDVDPVLAAADPEEGSRLTVSTSPKPSERGGSPGSPTSTPCRPEGPKAASARVCEDGGPLALPWPPPVSCSRCPMQKAVRYDPTSQTGKLEPRGPSVTQLAFKPRANWCRGFAWTCRWPAPGRPGAHTCTKVSGWSHGPGVGGGGK